MRLKCWLEPRVRRSMTIAAAIAALLAAGAVWMVIERASTRAPPRAMQPAEAAHRDTTPPVEKGASSATTASKDGEREQCDEGQVRLDEGVPEPQGLAYREAATTLSRLAQRLAAASDQKDRALGLFVQRYDFSGPFVGAAACRDDSCRQRFEDAHERAARPYRDSLANLASTTQNPDVYALAFYGCYWYRASPAEGSCALVSAAQWTRIDPDNAAAWFYASDDAAGRGDWQARDEAFFRASKATAFDPRWASLADLLQSDDAQSLGPTEQTAFGADLVGVLAAVPIPAYRGLLESFCSQTAVLDPNRRQVCSDLAEMMTQPQQSRINLILGLRLAERLHWPEDRLNALRELSDAVKQGFAEDLSHHRCWSSPAIRARMLDTLKSGDIGFAPRQIASSGRSVAQLAQAWRASHPPGTEQNPPASSSGAPTPR